MMTIKKALAGVLVHPWVRKLPATSLVALAVAAIIHSALAAVSFDLSAATAALARIGFTVAAGLLPALVEVAKKGVDELGDWLERELTAQPEINEAAARTLVEQAEVVAQTLEETHPMDKEAIADAVGTGLKAHGGAASVIAEDYASAMKNTAELARLVDQMRQNIDSWASQTVEAKRGSLIEDVEMRMKGKGGKQEIRAEDNSTIRGVKQSIDD
jgi:hypothetical protein